MKDLMEDLEVYKIIKLAKTFLKKFKHDYNILKFWIP